MDYTYFYKHCYQTIYELEDLEQYDVFISSYVNSERVLEPAEKIPAAKKIWFAIKSEQNDLFLTGKDAVFLDANEDYWPMHNKLSKLQLSDKRVCVDATGFRIPYLMFILRCLESLKVNKFDIIYTEPTQYRCAENTKFTDLFYEVKQMYGMAGEHSSQAENDLLIIAAGYDHSRIVDVATNKKSCAKKVLLFGFPAISPGMFQENILRAFKAEASIGNECFKDMELNIYAPAYDPFVTAQCISDYINKQNKKRKFTNIYLSPLSTKPQAIGMALYFLCEHHDFRGISLVYPYCKEYVTDNSDGVARVWRYEIELPYIFTKE